MNHKTLTAGTVETKIRERLLVQGVVQGVGFRPFIYGLALRLKLRGFVGNNSKGVFIEVEGAPEAVASFKTELLHNPPSLAVLENITSESIPLCGDFAFRIVPSEAQVNTSTLVSPDLSICEDCLKELLNPADRRFRYPFINCTNCGPRFTIIKDIPYDRPMTTMATFQMCPVCQAEYDDPLNRRFHAQPNACPVCGPQLSFHWIGQAEPLIRDMALVAAQKALAEGAIVAVKGVGGFHLACDATNTEAIQKLRQRKGRQGKSFALMAKDLNMIRQFAEVDEQEAKLLTSRERPIVLLKKKAVSALSEEVAPGNTYIGVMLPYTPLHYLLLDEKPLVMTSGNYSAEPIVKDNTEALTRLSPLADAFLLHNRDIHVPCDDSVVRLFEGQELPVRRSRGYAPFPVRLPFTVPPILAVGGELKSTFCLTRDNYAFMSQHLGDMENLETLEAFTHAYDHFRALFRTEPRMLVSDLHPRYLSAKWAAEFARRQNLPLLRVQHHHAHIGALMAENGLDGAHPVIGISFDGTGYGTDGAIWGGEVFVADYRSFRRVAHLKYIDLPGGDAAVEKPYRVALAYLWAADIPWEADLAPVATCGETEKRILRSQLEKNLNTISTSSMGRLFDAVAALAGVRQVISYEAQAAIELEALLDPGCKESYHFDLLENSDDPEVISFTPDSLLLDIVADLEEGLPVSLISAKFHNAVAELIVELCLLLRQREGLNSVALSGGVFQNVSLLKVAVSLLRKQDFVVYTHHLVPPNDGGLALGQAVIASQLYR